MKLYRADFFGGEMEPSDDGDWVRREDYEKLQAWVKTMEELTTDLDPPDMLVHWHEDNKARKEAESKIRRATEILRSIYMPDADVVRALRVLRG
jgi:hypothetical protein